MWPKITPVKISRKNLQFLFYQKNEKKAQRYPFDEHKSRRAKRFDEKRRNGDRRARARAQFHMVICPKIARFGPKSLFFKNFVRLDPKYIYIVKITFLAQILNVFPLYGWCLPLKWLNEVIYFSHNIDVSRFFHLA